MLVPSTISRSAVFPALRVPISSSSPRASAPMREALANIAHDALQKMRAGQVPGIVNVGEFSADGGHLRSGLPRYTLAATYYAVLFREHPGAVDWKIFQERSNYDSGKFGFYVHQPDLAVHLDITPERAKVVNDTIWEVVSAHPCTGVQRRESTER